MRPLRFNYQKGSLSKRGKVWIGQWRLDGKHFKRVLGRIDKMTKSEAKAALASILAPINARQTPPSNRWSFAEFINQVYLPLFGRKWKTSTLMTNSDRIKNHLISEFGNLKLGDFNREQLQVFLDRKAGLSFSVVDHLRWDLKQIFDLAMAEGFLLKNPAQLLFTPRDCPRPKTRVMTFDQVRTLFAVLEVRAKLVALLAVIAGMRPGEIFALTWKMLTAQYADITQRVYRGKIDSPKSWHSVRWAALSDGLIAAIEEWRALAVDSSPDAWVFPSERLTTPLRKDNCWRRDFLPRLKAVGLEWANFQVMRRTHSSLLNELDVDPQVRAEQMGHTIDVNQNVYTRSSLERRREAVNKLESALKIM